MKPEQEPKYMIVDENGVELPGARIANRRTGAPIPDDEPLMIFRAKDPRFGQPLHLYAELCKNPGHQRNVMARHAEFKAFQDAHPELRKEPD